MIAVVFCALMISNIYISMMRGSSKLLAFLLWLSMLFVYAGNTRTGFSDLPSYRARYEFGSSSVFFTEKGYTFLADYMSSRGYSFHIFLATLFVLSSLCMLIVFVRINVNYNVIVCLLGLFYLFFVMEGLRYFVATSLAFLGLYFLKEGTIKSRALFIALIVLGATFHKSIIFLAPFVFVYRCDGLNKKTLRILLFVLISISIGLIVLNFLTNNSGSYLQKYLYLFGDDSVSAYKANFYILNQKRVRFGFAYYFVYFFMNIWITKSINHIYESNNVKKSKYADMANQYNVFSIIYLPFIMISTTFFRPLLVGAIVSFTSLAEVHNDKTINLRYKYKNKVEWKHILEAIIIWFVIWWYLKINAIGPFEALMQNLFF